MAHAGGAEALAAGRGAKIFAHSGVRGMAARRSPEVEFPVGIFIVSVFLCDAAN